MVHTMDSPPFDLQAYQPPMSLWKLVLEQVPTHESEEVKNMLGESLVDQSLELHDEIDILLDIWRDYREETTHVKPVTHLPEPPGVRDRLMQEIQFFVGNIKEKANEQGVNPNKLLSRQKTDILEYAFEGSRPGSARPSSRQMTARSADGRETPMLISPTCSDRTSAASTLSEEVESMNDKLTVLKFDEVCQHLREILDEEVQKMKQDIVFLQGCLDDEATFRAESSGELTREPTLSDLRETRSSLEKELLSDMRSQTSPELKPSFNPQANIKKLSPVMVGSARIKVDPVKSTTQPSALGKPGPMKAFSATEGPRTSPDFPSGSSSPRRHKHHVGDSIGCTTPSGDNINRANQNLVTQGHRRAQCDRDTVSERFEESHARTVSRGGSGHDKSSLGAVVTLTKGKAGESEATEVHLIPSPPSVARAATPQRPSSAQRFRKMVLDCRD